MYRFRLPTHSASGSELGAGAAFLPIWTPDHRSQLNTIWGGTIERSIAAFINGAVKVRLDFDAVAAPGQEWQRLGEYQFVQGCMLVLRRGVAVTFAVVEDGVPRVLMLPR